MIENFKHLQAHIIEGVSKVSTNLGSIGPWEKISGIHRIPGEGSLLVQRSVQNTNSNPSDMVLYEEIMLEASLAEPE